MKTKGKMKWRMLAVAAACAGVAGAAGCELLVDFDRSKIPQEGGVEGDATVGDGSQGDVQSEEDGTLSDSPVTMDAAADSPAESSSDGAMEGGRDATLDSPPETGDDGSDSSATGDDSGDDGGD